jgi:hypothetical protein
MAKTKRKTSTRKSAARKSAARKSAARKTAGGNSSLSVFLMTLTEAGKNASPRERAAERARVSEVVKKADARCQLFATTPKSGNEQLVSLIEGLSTFASKTFANEISRKGFVTADLLFKILKGGP